MSVSSPADTARRTSRPFPSALNRLGGRRLDHYPESGRRYWYLAIVVLTTIVLYYAALRAVRGGDRRSSATPHDVPVLRLDIGDRQRGRRLRVAGGRARRPLGPGEHGGLRPAGHRPCWSSSGCRTRRARSPIWSSSPWSARRGHRAGRDPGADPGLLTAARPGHGDGLLDDGAGHRQPRRHHGHQPHLQRLHHLAGRGALRGHQRPRRVRRRAVRPARAVPAAARPDHGEPAGPGAGRGARQGDSTPRRPSADQWRQMLRLDVVGSAVRHQRLPAAVLRRRRQLRGLLRHQLRLLRAARQRAGRTGTGRRTPSPWWWPACFPTACGCASRS